MLRGRLSSGVFILGLDAENIRRLTAGEPIALSLMPLGGTDTITIIYGNTLADIQGELERAQGCPLPEPIPLAEANIRAGH